MYPRFIPHVWVQIILSWLGSTSLKKVTLYDLASSNIIPDKRHMTLLLVISYQINFPKLLIYNFSTFSLF